MGILPALESRPRLAFPDTPPELVSPGASSYSSSSSLSADQQQQSWISPPLTSPSMSNYEKHMTTDMSAEKSVEGGQSRPESSSQGAPRQQLPSLSSLFGPPSSVRPLHSPVSDRQASYSATSPLDRPRAPSGDRHQPASYFSQTLSPPAAHPRTTYDPKFDSDRHASHGVSTPFGAPESPRYREQPDHARPASRPDGLSGKWPMPQDAGRHHDYHLGSSRDSSFRLPQEQFRLQFPAPKDRMPPSYPEQKRSHGEANPPPTPTSTVASEGIPSKDGLGPKIWTGTHFLPRFVRAAEVPGEGLCYFYDDGSHCKTIIDGEAVNAHWGVTKAGKPRKRLAIACVTCREKKIKCDPDYPRCLQCEKFGRVCKFKNAPRGGHNTSPSTPPAELDDVSKGGPSRQAELQASGSEASSPVSPRTTLRQGSPDDASHKRLRVGYDSYVSAGEMIPPIVPPEPVRTPLPVHQPVQAEVPELPRIPDSVLNRAWATDPSTSDVQSIQSVMASYFTRLDCTRIVQFIPETPFKAWVNNSSETKSADDLMLLYSVLSVGVALAGGSNPIAFEYAQVANYAQRMTTTPSLQLVQSRILLCLYYLSISHIADANDMLSEATAVMMSLKLNIEPQESDLDGMEFPFGMGRWSYLESRRRTFWALFMLERLNGYFPERPAMVNAEDTYTRLPADMHSFDRDLESSSPMFNPYVSKPLGSNDRELGISAYLVDIVHIWSTTISRIYRMARHTALPEMDLELRRLQTRILDWYQMLPRRLRFSPSTTSNLEAASLAGELGPFLTMHILYNHAMTKLNRHSTVGGRTSTQASRLRVQRCYEHSRNVLEMVKTLLRLHRSGQDALGTVPPVMAMAATEAVDVLTASGRLSHMADVVEDVRMTLSIVEATGPMWEDPRGAREAIDGRLAMLLRIRERGNQPTSPIEGYRIIFGVDDHHADEKTFRWQINNPIERLYPKDLDGIYSPLI